MFEETDEINLVCSDEKENMPDNIYNLSSTNYKMKIFSNNWILTYNNNNEKYEFI